MVGKTEIDGQVHACSGLAAVLGFFSCCWYPMLWASCRMLSICCLSLLIAAASCTPQHTYISGCHN